MAIDLRALDPAPSKVVANLPYGIAAGALLRTIEELPSVGLWVAMVQREVGERLAARPGGGAYGIPSVLAQLACEVEVVRAIPRTVFVPVPNVDSVLVRLRRRRAGPGGEQPPGSLRRCGSSWRAPSRTGARRSRARSRSRKQRGGARASRCGRRSSGSASPPTLRAERLAPEEFSALARLLER